MVFVASIPGGGLLSDLCFGSESCGSTRSRKGLLIATSRHGRLEFGAALVLEQPIISLENHLSRSCISLRIGRIGRSKTQGSDPKILVVNEIP